MPVNPFQPPQPDHEWQVAFTSTQGSHGPVWSAEFTEISLGQSKPLNLNALDIPTGHSVRITSLLAHDFDAHWYQSSPAASQVIDQIGANGNQPVVDPTYGYQWSGLSKLVPATGSKNTFIQFKVNGGSLLAILRLRFPAIPPPFITSEPLRSQDSIIKEPVVVLAIPTTGMIIRITIHIAS